MGSKIKKGIALLISAVLAATTCVTTIPELSETVYATGTGKNIQLGAGALEDNVNTANAVTVYYGNNGDTWRVIGYNGTGVASSSGTLTLIASGNLGHDTFDRNTRYINNYSGSLLNLIIETLAGRLSTEEADAVVKRRLEGGSGNLGTSGTPVYNSNKISGSDVIGAVMWPLSAAEADLMNSDLRKADPSNSSSLSSYWWLRSPGVNDYFAAYVTGVGDVVFSGDDLIADNYGVRPAFNLNLSSILLISAADGGKDAGGTLGMLNEIAPYSGTEWKLTILDSSRNGFTASAGTGATLSEEAGYTSWTVPVTYSDEESGVNEHIAAILADSDGNALYYGHIYNSVTIPTGLSAGTYTLNIFNEQCNADRTTDLSSPFSTITLTVTAGSNSGQTPSGQTPPRSTPPATEQPVEEMPEDYLDELRAKIAAAIALGGKQTVTWDQGTLLPYDIMKTLQDNPNITLVFSYRYLNKDYKVTLPGKKVKAYANIPFYGPLYLNAYYGEKGTKQTSKNRS